MGSRCSRIELQGRNPAKRHRFDHVLVEGHRSTEAFAPQQGAEVDRVIRPSASDQIVTLCSNVAFLESFKSCRRGK